MAGVFWVSVRSGIESKNRGFLKSDKVDAIVAQIVDNETTSSALPRNVKFQVTLYSQGVSFFYVSQGVWEWNTVNEAVSAAQALRDQITASWTAV